MFRHLIAISAAIALASTGSVSLAQSRGGGGMSSSGMGGGGGSAFGGGGMGSSGFGGSGGFGSGMGSSGMGGGMGQSGFGGSGSSGFGGGQSGFGNSGFGNSSGAGGQQNFVGRDATDMQAAFGQMGNKTATQFMNNMNRSMRSNSSRRSTKKTVQTTTQSARIEVKVAFNPPRPPAAQVARDISTRLAKLLAANHMSQPKMNMEGDTVVLSGAAASENERDVISQLLAIEPGVRNVRNEMTIGQPAGSPSGMSPAPGS